MGTSAVEHCWGGMCLHGLAFTKACPLLLNPAGTWMLFPFSHTASSCPQPGVLGHNNAKQKIQYHLRLKQVIGGRGGCC